MSFTSEASSPFVSKGRRNVSIKQCPYTSHRDEVYNDPALLPFAAMSPHQHLSLLPAQYSGDFHHPQAIVLSQLQYQPPHRLSNSPPTSEDATACVYSCRFSPFIAIDRISLHLQFGCPVQPGLEDKYIQNEGQQKVDKKPSLKLWSI